MAQILGWSEQAEIRREGQVVVGKLLRPHRVVSTAPRGGGSREDVTGFYNHQSCEPAGHGSDVMSYISEHEQQLHDELCLSHGLDPARTVRLGTAANMRCLGLSQREFRDLRVAAICTAGVEGNAGRAGDPASMYELDGAWHRVAEHEQPEHGTIVTILLLNRELTPGALARTLMTATEAKSALLHELVVGSRYSPGIATGTGTDQFLAACPLTGAIPLTSAGKHSMTGQLVAEAVAAAIEDALVLQNGLTRASRCSVTGQLGRFGLTRSSLLQRARSLLDPTDASLLEANFLGIDADPHIVAAGASMAAVADQVRHGVLPESCLEDYAVSLGGWMASAAAGGRVSATELGELLAGTCLGGTRWAADLAERAICLGYARKWPHFSAIPSSGGSASSR